MESRSPVTMRPLKSEQSAMRITNAGTTTIGSHYGKNNDNSLFRARSPTINFMCDSDRQYSPSVSPLTHVQQMPTVALVGNQAFPNPLTTTHTTVGTTGQYPDRDTPTGATGCGWTFPSTRTRAEPLNLKLPSCTGAVGRPSPRDDREHIARATARHGPRLSITSFESCITSTSAKVQHSYIELLREICTEAARRKRQTEVQRRLVADFHHARQQRTLRGRRSPRSDHNCTPYGRMSCTSTPTGASSPRLLRLISSIADEVWQSARRSKMDVHAQEKSAVAEMSMIYELAGKIVVMLEKIENGEAYGGDDLKRAATEARTFCEYLGYEEGRRRCEELVEEWKLWADADGSGDVL